MTLTAAGTVNIGSSRFVRSGKMPSTGLKIRMGVTLWLCGENCVGLKLKEAVRGVYGCKCNGLRSAINVSKYGHNVTGALATVARN